MNLRIHSRYCTIGIAFALVIAIAVFLFFSRSENKLTYKDRTIDEWFEYLPLTMVMSGASPRPTVFEGSSISVGGGRTYGGDTNTISLALEAFENFGTNAIPFLLSKLESEDRKTEQQLMKLANKLGGFPLGLRNSEVERGLSVSALIHLEELPADALQSLTNLSKHPNPSIADSASYILAERVKNDQKKAGENQKE